GDGAVAVGAEGGGLRGKCGTPRRRRVLLLSGEADEANLYDRLRRICQARGVGHADVNDHLFAHTGRLPQMGSPADLNGLAEAIRRYEADVVILDCLYLALGSGCDASNMFEVGPRVS